MKIVKNDLYDYPNRYIYQYVEGFKFSLDSILLAEYVKINKTCENILDMCTGNAPVPLILSTKTNKKIIGFELQKDIYTLAVESVKLNNLENQIEVINDDILNIDKIFPGKYFDVITCNPPYFPVSEESLLNKNDLLTIARHEVKINLDQIFQIVSNHLKDNGVFYMVHRPNRLDEIITYANKYKVFVKEIQLIVTKKNLPSMMIIRCQKHAKCGIRFKEIINVNNLDSYQHIFEEE